MRRSSSTKKEFNEKEGRDQVPPPLPRLVVESGEQSGLSLEISDSLTIGSNRSSTLHLRDAAVSWNHARVWREGGELFVADQESATGTLLNGSPVEQAKLKAGDVLVVGSTQLVVQTPGHPAGGSGAGQGVRRESLEEGGWPELRALQKKLAETSKELEAAREEGRVTTEALASTESKLAVTEKRVVAGGRKVKDAAAERGQLAKELQASKKKLSESSRVLATAQSSGVEVQAELDRHARENDALREEVQSLESSEKNSQCELEKERETLTEMARKLEGLKGDLESARKAKETLRVEMEAQSAGLERELETLRLRLEASSSTVSQEQELRSRDRETITVLEERLEKVTDRLDQRSEQVVELERAKAIASSAAEQEQELRSRDRGAVTVLEERLEKVTGRLDQRSEQVVELEREKVAVVAERDRLKASLRAFEGVREELERVRTKNDKDFARLRELEVDRVTLQERLRGEEERAGRLGEERGNLVEQVETVRREAEAKIETSRENERAHSLKVDDESRQHFARLEEATVELLAEKDALRSQVETAEDRASRLKVVLAEQEVREERELKKEREKTQAAEIRSGEVQEAGRQEVERKGELVEGLREDLGKERKERVELAAQVESLTEEKTRLGEDTQRLQDAREKEQQEMKALRVTSEQVKTEVAMVRTYLDELKEKLKEKERKILEQKAEIRRESGDQAARLLREKRKLESFVEDLSSAGSTTPE